MSAGQSDEGEDAAGGCLSGGRTRAKTRQEDVCRSVGRGLQYDREYPKIGLADVYYATDAIKRGLVRLFNA